jgi:hypothetical protein
LGHGAESRLRIADLRQAKLMKITNHKTQITNKSQCPKFEIQNPNLILEKNPKYVWVIRYWNLRFTCNLVLGIWDFGMRIEKCEMQNDKVA